MQTKRYPPLKAKQIEDIRSPIPKIVVTPPKTEKAGEKATPLSPTYTNTSLSCDEEDAVEDSDSLSDVSLDSPPRKDKRKRIFPRVMNAKKKLRTTGKKKAGKEAKAGNGKSKGDAVFCLATTTII